MSKSSKGSSFERELARTLSLWWSGGRRDDLCWRVSASGGRATVRSRKGQDTSGQHGDICATTPDMVPFFEAFTVEAKRGYKTWSMMDAIDRPARSKPSVFEDFLEQAVRQSEEAGTLCFLLVTKKDRREPIVFTNYVWLRTEMLPQTRGLIHLQEYSRTIRFMTLSAFLKSVRPEDFR